MPKSTYILIIAAVALLDLVFVAERESSNDAGSAPWTAPDQPPTTPQPAAIAGRPFPVSASVVASCKVGGCPELNEMLSKFTREPRDTVWATGMESKLWEFARSNAGQVRKIECRTTWCVMEVASTGGPFLDVISANNTLNPLLTERIDAHGNERGPSSAPVVVTLRVLARR